MVAIWKIFPAKYCFNGPQPPQYLVFILAATDRNGNEPIPLFGFDEVYESTFIGLVRYRVFLFEHVVLNPILLFHFPYIYTRARLHSAIFGISFFLSLALLSLTQSAFQMEQKKPPRRAAF